MKLRYLLLMILIVMLIPSTAIAQDGDDGLSITSEDILLASSDREYESYIAYPDEGGPYPGIVLIHSFRGLEEGYRTLVDQFAAQGYVVLAIGWQTYEQSPSDEYMTQLMTDSTAFLAARDDVDGERLGLTGFCAGGAYTMQYLAREESFAAGVAWYGFPYIGSPSGTELIDQLEDPMLIIHGTADRPSPIASIYEYALALDAADADFEMKIYSGEPHSFVLDDGQLSDSSAATDAVQQMITFFDRTLKVAE